MSRFLAAAAAAAAAAACASAPASPGEARKLNEDFLAAQGDALAAEFPGRFLVVQDGAVAGRGLHPDDALRAAGRKRPGALHRFVFRPEDRGERLYRLAFLPAGGRVAGRGLLAALGLRATVPPGGGLAIARAASGETVAGSPTGRLLLDVSNLDGSAREVVEAAVDPDFDGGLVLDRTSAERLRLDREEVPGAAEVQVALGRPFAAKRVLVLVRLPQASARGVVEALVETAPGGVR